jgi:hypothetical protein
LGREGLVPSALAERIRSDRDDIVVHYAREIGAAEADAASRGEEAAGP